MSKFNHLRNIICIKLGALLSTLEDLLDEYPQLVEECAGLVEAYLDQAMTQILPMKDSTLRLPLDDEEADNDNDES